MSVRSYFLPFQAPAGYDRFGLISVIHRSDTYVRSGSGAEENPSGIDVCFWGDSRYFHLQFKNRSAECLKLREKRAAMPGNARRINSGR